VPQKIVLVNKDHKSLLDELNVFYFHYLARLHEIHRTVFVVVFSPAIKYFPCTYFYKRYDVKVPGEFAIPNGTTGQFLPGNQAQQRVLWRGITDCFVKL